METKQMTMTAFCESRGITATVKQGKDNPAMAPDKHAPQREHQWYAEASHYRVTLHREDGRRMVVPFSCGSLAGYPDVEGVLDCLCSDAASTEDSFEEWCSNMGYDTDSRKALRTFEECESIAERLKSFLGADYQMAVYELERM